MLKLSAVTTLLVAEASGLRVPTTRREVVTRSAALAGAAWVSRPLPVLAAPVDYAGAKGAIMDLIQQDENLGPTLLRLAWHSSGTYDKMSKTGGSGGGTIRFKEELAHGGNAGLDKMVAKLEPVKSAYPGISYADLYTLAGVTALEAAGLKVPWKAGRVDAMSPDAVTPDGRLPAADKGKPSDTIKALRMDVFYRMGFNDQEIVALSGARASEAPHDSPALGGTSSLDARVQLCHQMRSAAATPTRAGTRAHGRRRPPS